MPEPNDHARRVFVDGAEFRVSRLLVPADGEKAHLRWWIVDPKGRDHVGPLAPNDLMPLELEALIRDWWATKQALGQG